MKLFGTFRNGSRKQQIDRFCKELEENGKCFFQVTGVNDCKLAMMAFAIACEKYKKLQLECTTIKVPFGGNEYTSVMGEARINKGK